MWSIVGVGVVAAGVLIAVRLTGNDEDDGSSGGGELEMAPDDLTVDDLRPALITNEDVGSQYSESFDSGQSLSDDDFQMSDECQAAFDHLAAATDIEGGLTAEFERTSDGARVSQGFVLIDEETPSLDEIRDTWTACGTTSIDNGQLRGELSMHTEHVLGPGDEALGFELAVDLSSGPVQTSYEGYGIASVRGGVLSTVFAFGGVDQFTGQAHSVDRDLVRQLAALADRRLQDVLAA